MSLTSGAIPVLVAVALPFLAAALVPLLWRVLGERTGYAGAGVALVSFSLLAGELGREGTVAVPWIPSLDVALRFHVDGWGLLFALLASGIGVLVFLYSATYMHGERGLRRYYGSLLAFMGAILGVALAADLVALFLFWELTSVASFLLIGHHDGDAESRYAARMAMVVTVVGGLFLLVGFLLLVVASGRAFGTETFDLTAMLANADAMRAALRETGLFLPALAFVAVGAASKSAQVPLHFWLPNAMAAPTPVSAFLHSATMVKVGVYLLGRLRPLFLGVEWTLLLVTLGLATMVVGAVLAVASTDIKELLAYSTASHLGLMVAGFGFASAAGAETGAFHLFNHALFKAALFLVAGIVAHEAGTRRLDELGGLRRDLPFTAVVAGVAALSMAGVPPFNGFYSKEYLFKAAYEAASAAGGLWWLYPTAAVVASIFTVLYSARFLALFFGDRPEALGEVHRPPATMLAPPALLAAVAFVVGLAPGLAVDVAVGAAIDATAVGAPEFDPHLPTELSPPVAMSVVSLGVGASTYPVYGRVHRAIRRARASAPALRPNWWYDRTLGGIDRVGAELLPRIQTGLLRTYAAWALGAAAALVVAGYVAAGVALPTEVGVDAPPATLVVLAVALVGAVAMTRAPSHVVGVLALSLLGFMVAVFYTLASAPDLALTQLVVETLSLLVFLLVLEKLPEYYGELDRRLALRDAVLSLGVGAAVFLTVLVSTRGPDGETALARYFVEKAVPEGGGTNVVNVILVDFRAFDTLGEVAVIVMAALSVLTLLTMRRRGESP
ncbi:hydrogen gas-evolving membrane-bound hydrogenase subunit E [Halobium salinum]|uniref:Hydrogen gas-evolving membrane-bound hydrogenase subunit E n=1 Tax=Halobium salinum TaxID=1364940 RepID=A0ABD5PFB4_9EURY|nr:hydrogen gas-evolving membrane-bound hydrogenase subunit E [Halobium salinum]